MSDVLQNLIHILFRAGIFLGGVWLVTTTVMAAVRSFVLPRSDRPLLTTSIFRGMFRIFRLRLRKAVTYEERDRIMAFYAPLTLLVQPVVWLILIGAGYMGMYWAIMPELTPKDAFVLSGSSLLTLGARFDGSLGIALLEFSEATLGLVMVALLIAYLPTIYGAFSRREAMVNRLEVRAGVPPSSAEMIMRLHRIGMLTNESEMKALWENWEIWFAEVEETHTSLAALIFFRSPKHHRSWVTAAGTVLDAAALVASTIDIPTNVHIPICIRAGYICLRGIADFFGMPYNPDPKPDDPISISRYEFDDVCTQLAAAGIPLKEDRDQCWRDFVGWRVNYDAVLLQIAAITMAPYAPWVSDRSLRSKGKAFRPRATVFNFKYKALPNDPTKG